MPYGMPKKLGGDSAETDAKMESCVRDVMAKGKSKLAAILICKTSIDKSLAKKK